MISEKPLKALSAKWREEADGVTAMGYSQQGDRMRDCANDLDAIIAASKSARTRRESPYDLSTGRKGFKQGR